MSNVITDAMNIATENQHKIDNLYGVLNNYKLSKKNKGYENDHSNKSLKDIKEVLTSTDMGEVANTTAEAEPTDLVFGAKSPVVFKEELGDLEATYNTIPGSATGTQVNAACYGNGTIIVIPIRKSGSTMRKVYYSTDEGITWTEGNMPSSQQWRSVCYGKDKFVAFAKITNIFAYSLDGITWTQGTLPVSKQWRSVCYGKDKFVAVAYNTNIFIYSSDGITWTQGTLPASKYWKSVCYGKDKFVAVAYDTNIFIYSSDGITWTQGTMPSKQDWKSVCYGKDKFVTVAYNTNIFIYSLDGITWTQGTLPVSKQWYSVCYGKDKFVAVASGSTSNYTSSDVFAYSLDGITWTDGKLTYSTAKSKDFSDLRIVVPTSTGFMLFGASDSEIQYWKVDEVVKPIAFKQGNLLSINYWGPVCYGKDKFVALRASTVKYTFAYSLDGITWTEGTLPAKYWWRSVCYGKDKFVAVAQDTNIFIYSSDGITWTKGTLPVKEKWGYICYGKDKFVAVAGGSTSEYTSSDVFAYSLDGITWTEGTLPAKYWWRSVCYGKDKFVAVAQTTDTTDTFAYSSDGITWTEGNMLSEQDWISVCYGKDKFVAITFDSNVFAYSLDGITWAQGTLPESKKWISVCYGKDKFVAFARITDIFAYSLDGITWAQGTLPASKGWYYLCYGNDKFVAVESDSNSNAFVYSYDLPTYKNYAYHESALPADIGLSRNIEYEFTEAGFKTGSMASKPATQYWNTICYGNGKFVAIVYNSDVFAYSTDGITWTQGTLPISDSWYMCYGKDKFVLVGNNRALYSYDGINWNTGNGNVYNYIRHVCYGNDQFVAFSGSTDVIIYSDNGITWHPAQLEDPMFPVSSEGSCICYGNDKFVALSGSNVFAYSLDGITWTQGTLPSTQQWYSVCYGKDKFVAVAYNTNIFIYSSDGITWTQGTLPTASYWKSVCYGEDKFVVVRANYSAFAYSLDGIMWLDDSIDADYGFLDICYGKDKFVLIPDGNSNVSAYGSFNDSIITSFSPTYTLVSTDLSIKDILNSHGSSTGNYLVSTTSIETVDSNNYLNSTNVYTIDPTTYETAKVSSWDICKYIGDNKRPLMNNYRKIYAIKPIKNGMHKFFGWVYLDTHECRLKVIFTKDFINYYTLLLGNGDSFFAYGLGIPRDTDVSNITDTQITKAVQKYLSILPDNTIVYMNFSRMILKDSVAYKEDPTHPAEMCNIIDPFSNTQEVKSANNRITFMTIRDDYGTGDYQNKAIAGISAYLNDNGEIIVYYNNRSEMPLTIYNGRVMNNTPYSTKYTNYSKEVIASPKVAKLFGSATTDTTNNISTFKTSINNMSMDLAITTMDSKDNTKNANESYLPAASVSLAIGDVSDRIYNNEDERFKHFNKVALFVNEAIENMDNIDIDFSDYIETTAIDRDSVVKDGKNDKEYNENGDFMWGNLPSAQNWRCVCYGKDKFVTVAYKSQVFAYSSDGITWTEGNMPSSQQWRSVCYGKDKFVAVAYSSNIFAYSLDGITWTEGNMPSSSYWYSVCYGKDKFVAVAYNTNKFIYSSDGITWTKGTLPVSNGWISVCYGKDKFVAISCNTTNVFVYSSDGITWTQGTMPVSNEWGYVCYGKDKFVAVAYNTNKFTYSSDGITWTQGTLPSRQYWYSICYGKDKFVAVVYNTTNVFAYSSDGITWTQGNMPSKQAWYSICYGKDKFVVVANNTNVVAYALDADPKFITSKIYDSNTFEINNRSENTDSNLRYRATVIGNTLLPDKFHMNNPRFTK